MAAQVGVAQRRRRPARSTSQEGSGIHAARSSCTGTALILPGLAASASHVTGRVRSGSDCQARQRRSGGPARHLGSRRSAAALLTVDGAPPPLNAAAAKLHAERHGASGERRYLFRSDDVVRGSRHATHPHHAVSVRDPRDGDRLAFIHGWYRWLRVVDLAGGAVDPPLPLTMGFPVGHWEGDTLVIRTVGLSDVDRAGCVGPAAFGADDADRASARAAAMGGSKIASPSMIRKPSRSHGKPCSTSIAMPLRE